MVKKTRKKLRLKLVPFLILVVVLVLLYFLGIFLLDLKIKNIYIYDNNILSDQEIIELAKLEDYPSFLKTTSKKIKKNIESNQYIKKATVKKGFFNVVNIYIEEYNFLFINNITSKIVVEGGKEVERNNNIALPVLLNSVPDNIYNDFINEMNNINEDIKSQISEIKYLPSEYDETRFLLNMKDGNNVYINIVKFEKLNYYNEIYPTLNNRKGTLYLDSGNHFEVFK